MNDLPDWAQFDADMYQEIPDDWRGLDVGYELCEHSIYCDPDCGTAPEVEGLAAMVLAHRLEIVALRKELTAAQADNARLNADLEKVRTHQRAHIARLRSVRRAARQYRRQLDFAAAERHEAAEREIARLRGELSEEKQRRQETVDMCSQFRGQLAETKADFLWPHDDGSVDQAGYEFCNGKTEGYRREWWSILCDTVAAEAREAALENVAAWFEKKMFYDAADAVRSFKQPEQENPIEPPTREGE